MTKFDRAELDVYLRQDLVAFIQRTVQTVAPAAYYQHNWHIDAIAWHLEQCFAGNIRRLIITLPPRNLKSIAASVALPAWILGHNPSARIIAASYADALTAKHARDCLAVMQSTWYRQAFPGTRLNPKKITQTEFETTRHGFRYGTSLGGALTGRGGNFIIIDDPLKPFDAVSDAKREAANEWFDGTLFSRLDDKQNDVIILIMQRLHVDDLVGHLLAQGGGWVHLNLPAIAEEPQLVPIGPGAVYRRKLGGILHPAREPQSVLDEIKAQMGAAVFSAQYQQAPVQLGGNLVKWAWFQRYDRLPERTPQTQVVQSWDTASKAEEIHDYSVCTTWLVHNNEYYLVDVMRARLEYPALKRRIVVEAAHHNADTIIIEDKGSGTQLIQDLRQDRNVMPIAIKTADDKVTRMSAQSAKIEAGQVFIPRQAPWVGDFKAEMLAFPESRHDDQVDSVSQFLGGISTKRPKQNLIVPPAFAMPGGSAWPFSREGVIAASAEP